MKKLSIVGIFFLLLFGVITYQNIHSQAQSAIKVSGGVTTESQIMGNMIMQLIEHDSNYPVKYLNNLASAQVNQVAMQRGQLDISSVRYTGTDLVTTLGQKIIKDPDKALKVVQDKFAKKYDFAWYPSYGFANQFTFMVTKGTAEKYHLTKVSDLQKYASQWKLGTDSGWYQRQGDGYQAFTQAYQMKFSQVYPMNVSLLYEALHANQYNVILGYSTDGRIRGYGFVLLKDDRQFFPPYTCSLVVNKKIYKKYPKLPSILHKLEDKISTKTMQELNYQADVKLIEPQIVARKFLEEHHYFEGDK